MPEIQQADRDAARAMHADNVKRLASLGVPEESLMDMLARHLAAHREAERERIVRMLDATIKHFWKLNAEHSGNAEQELFTTGAITALGIVKEAIVEPAKLAALIAAFGIEVGVKHG